MPHCLRYVHSMLLLQGDGVAALSTRAGLWHYFAKVHGHRTVPVEIWQPVTLCSEKSGDSNKPGAPVAEMTGQGNACSDVTDEAEGGLEEQLMTLHEFTTCHLLADQSTSVEAAGSGTATRRGVDSDGTVAYLAQHALFDQIPAFWELVRVFPWVNVGSRSGSGEDSNNASGLLHANVWLGEGGTITGLHFDSYDNFLLQLHGYKYV